jgi:hypothetical protein
MEPSTSPVLNVVVQSTPVGVAVFEPLPTQFWETPINAQNVQNWAAISGPWPGLAAATFGSTGVYNASGSYNPYTTTPQSGHVLWTKVWLAGGVAGGFLGNSEQNSDYWTTRQYDPEWNAIIMDGIEYATQYDTTNSMSMGIVAYDLYDGQTLFRVNTTNALAAGMAAVNWYDIDQYGDVGPYFITTGNLPLSDTGEVAIPESLGSTQINIYDGLTGTYMASIVNGTFEASLFGGGMSLIGTDTNGNIIGYIFNTTAGSMTCGQANVNPTISGAGTITEVSGPTNPCLEMWNMTACLDSPLIAGGSINWAISTHEIVAWKTGIQLATNVPNNITAAQGGFSNGVAQTTTVALTSLSAYTGNTLIGEFIGTGTGFITTGGFAVEVAYDATTGQQLWATNRTDASVGNNLYQTFTRGSSTGGGGGAADGVYTELNYVNLDYAGFSTTTGAVLYAKTLPPPPGDGTAANAYNEFDMSSQVDPTLGILCIWGLGGDCWAINITNGNVLWDFNTNSVNGSPGEETPYGVNPLWIFTDWAMGGQGSATTLYLPEGHMYAPPLIHNQQLLAVNVETGAITWHELFYGDVNAQIADGILTSLNCYDGQVYGFGMGPSATTISAPSVGVTTATPVVIKGSVTDVSPGASQEVQKADFPNGLPCVSDASESQFMETVYQQQPEQHNVTGVQVTLTDVDPNGNYETIGTTTSDGYTGSYGITWTPPIAGNYTITATFAGSNSYYGSYATTFLYAGGAPATPSPAATPQSLTPVSNDVIGLGIAAIVVIIVIGAILALLMLRKRP